MVASKKILIVEDERALRQALVDKFLSEGYTVFEAGNGNDGLRLAEEHLPDLILLDLLMPGMGGVEMMKRLDEDHPKAKEIPVIILTNLDPDDAQAKDLVANKPAWYLLKADWKLEQIVQKVRALVG